MLRSASPELVLQEVWGTCHSVTVRAGSSCGRPMRPRCRTAVATRGTWRFLREPLCAATWITPFVQAGHTLHLAFPDRR
jgi:hypothetical protein